RLHAVQRVVGASGILRGPDAVRADTIAASTHCLSPLEQFCDPGAQLLPIPLRKRRLVRARTDRDLVDTVEALPGVAGTHSRELKSVQQERNLGRTAHTLLDHAAPLLRDQGHDTVDR